MWLIDQPEILSTINLIPSAAYRGIPLTLIIGLPAMLLIIIFARKLTPVRLIFLVLVFWLPLYANTVYNASYDLVENFSYHDLNLSKKRVLRLCNIDHRQGLNNSFCQLFSFFIQSKKVLPKNPTVALAVAPGMDIFFQYYLFPDFKFSDQAKADYLLYYFPFDYRFLDGSLYRRGKDPNGSDKKMIGNYFLKGALGPAKLILEKTTNANTRP